MIVILGESGSGKDTLVNEFITKHPEYKKLIHYTTRPMRENETQDKDYHFTSVPTFKEMLKKDFFIEMSVYRKWYYGISRSDCESADDHTLAIVTPHALRALRASGIEINSVLLHVDRTSRLMNMLSRGDNVDEAYRRNLSDVGQFDGVMDEVDSIIDNTYYHMDVDQCVNVLEAIISDTKKEVQDEKS